MYNETTSYTTLFVMHLTIRNLGDETISPEEVLFSGLLFGSDYDEGGHSKWMYYDEISEKWQDKLDPNEKHRESLYLIFQKKINTNLYLVTKDLVQIMLTPVI